jgi:hypothetical protein
LKRAFSPSISASTLCWLLEPTEPSVRYLTLTELLGFRPENPEVLATRAEIMTIGPVLRILAGQKPGGYWGRPEDFYVRSKYKGTVWSLILLAELDANGRDRRIHQACEFVLKWSQDRESGGFSHYGTADGGEPGSVIPCLSGNMVWSMIRFGMLDDPRAQQGIDYIVNNQRFDDGCERPRGGQYDRHLNCWGRHTCHMGVVKALKALAEIPESRRSVGVNRTLRHGVEYLLQHHIYKRSHDLHRVSKTQWLRLGFPHMWNDDVLEILGILAKLRVRDPRMDEAIALVESKRDSSGRWNLESSFNGRTRARIELEGKPGKWVTLNAIATLASLSSCVWTRATDSMPRGSAQSAAGNRRRNR